MRGEARAHHSESVVGGAGIRDGHAPTGKHSLPYPPNTKWTEVTKREGSGDLGQPIKMHGSPFLFITVSVFLSPGFLLGL